MTEAEQAVAQLAHLQSGQYHLVYLPRPAGESSFTQIRSWALASLGFSLPQGSGGEALTQAQLLLQYSRPYGIFAYLPIDPRLS